MVKFSRAVITICLFFALTTIVSICAANAATLKLQWEPNADSTVGYRVSWGTSSGIYTQAVDVGQQTFFEFEAPTSPTVYFFTVRAYDASGVESAPSAEVNTGVPIAPIRVEGIDASAASPQQLGTTLTFKARVQGGVAPYQYKWAIFDGAKWRTVADWSARDTLTWRPDSAGDDYLVRVRVHGATSEDVPEAESRIPFVVTRRPLPAPKIQSSGAAPQPPKTAIRFTAQAQKDGRRYQYKWWVFNGASWAVMKEWSASRSFVWKPMASNAGYRVLVRAMNMDDPADIGGTSIPFPIAPERRRSSTRR